MLKNANTFKPSNARNNHWHHAHIKKQQTCQQVTLKQTAGYPKLLHGHRRLQGRTAWHVCWRRVRLGADGSQPQQRCFAAWRSVAKRRHSERNALAWRGRSRVRENWKHRIASWSGAAVWLGWCGCGGGGGAVWCSWYMYWGERARPMLTLRTNLFIEACALYSAPTHFPLGRISCRASVCPYGCYPSTCRAQNKHISYTLDTWFIYHVWGNKKANAARFESGVFWG